MIIIFIYVFLHVDIRKKGGFSMKCTKVQKSVSITIFLTILGSFCYFFDFAITEKNFYSSGETLGNFLKTSISVESPILIDAQAIGVDAHNWTWASSQYWCNGSGTKLDPYRISYLEIDGMGVNNCIEIKNSKNPYFTIEHCDLYNGGSNISNTITASIFLNNSMNGKIYSNNLTESTSQLACGIYIKNCTSIEVSSNNMSNNFYGILVSHSYASNITGNIIQDNKFMGASIQDISQTINLDHNLINNNLEGVSTLNSSYIWIWNNLIKNNYDNVICTDCYLIYVQNNTISKGEYGIYIQECNTIEVWANTIQKNQHGVSLKVSDTNSIKDNKIINNYYYPLKLEQSNNNNILRNIITGNKETVIQIECKDNYFEENIIFNQPEQTLLIIVVVLVGFVCVTGILIYRKIKMRKLG